MSEIINQIRKELKQNIDEEYRKGSVNFFKEKMVCYGVRTPTVRKIANKYFADLKAKTKKEIFVLCEELLKSDYQEEATIAFSWARRLSDQFEQKDFKLFERWVKKYVNNWAKCDDFCAHTLGTFIGMYPKYIKNLKAWTKSKNRWVRRASAVALIFPSRNKKFLPDIFQMADLLLKDEDDLVQKGYGWMLKVAADSHPKEVFDYVMKNKAEMPRTALRYAIEKYPQSMRKKAMG